MDNFLEGNNSICNFLMSSAPSHELSCFLQRAKENHIQRIRYRLDEQMMNDVVSLPMTTQLRWRIVGPLDGSGSKLISHISKGYRLSTHHAFMSHDACP